MSTFAGQIGASGGDSVQQTTGSAGELTATTPGFNTAGYTYCAFRFTNVTIAQGATVSAADIQIYGQSSKALSMDGTFYAEAADNSASLSTSANDISGRTKTSASTVWTATLTASAFNTSPDIKTAIQEVVNRASWASGNALTIIGIARSTSSAALGQYDDASSHAAKLDVTYTVTTTALPGRGIGTGTAQNPTVLDQPNASLGTAAGTAQTPSAQVTTNAGLATGSGTAQTPTVITIATATAGLGTGIGTAFDPTVIESSTATAGLSSGTGSAADPTVQIQTVSGLAAATGTAYDAVAQTASDTTATAGLSAGTGAALDPTLSATITAGRADAVGTAADPTAQAASTAGSADSTGTANDPTVTFGGPETIVNCDTATGTGQAFDAVAYRVVDTGMPNWHGPGKHLAGKFHGTPQHTTVRPTAAHATAYARMPAPQIIERYPSLEDDDEVLALLL